MALINQLNNLGDAVRERTSTTEKLTLDEMAVAIKEIPYPVVEQIEITENGTYVPNEGVDGFFQIDVNVESGSVELPRCEEVKF